ncbi:hypothetical protein ACI09J_002674 [Cronobacter turicensis]
MSIYQAHLRRVLNVYLGFRRFIPAAKKQHPIVFMNDTVDASVYSLFLRLPVCVMRLYNMVKDVKSGDLPSPRFMLKNM